MPHPPHLETAALRRRSSETRSLHPRPSLQSRPPVRGTDDTSDAPRPFLKWAGGKRQLLPELRLFYPREFGTYFEPFVGSGAVFFDLAAQGRLDGRAARLADMNPDVIGCYQAVRAHLPDVVRQLRRLAREFARDGEAHYYEVRDRRFNPLRHDVFGRGARRRTYPVELAAMLIYLNRTGFNGLFRLNSRGQFNVPAGRYANPRICDEAALRAASSALTMPGVDIRHEPFDSVRAHARRGDFVYFDPPYAPLSATSRFTSYTPDGFSDEDQRALQRVVLALAASGCHVLLSNSTAPIVRELYEGSEARSAGLRIWRVLARRAINARSTARGPIHELVIANIPRRHGRAAH